MANFTVVYDANVLYLAPLKRPTHAPGSDGPIQGQVDQRHSRRVDPQRARARRRLCTGGLLQPTPPWGISENVVKNSIPTGTAFLLRGGGVRPDFKRSSMPVLKHLNFQYNFLPASAN